MKFSLSVLILLSAGVFCACTPSSPTAVTSDGMDAPVVRPGAIPELSCAEFVKQEESAAVTLGYGLQSIYSPGAVLPTREGLVCLDALANWLSSAPPMAWHVTVGSESDTRLDAQTVAEKRQQLLQRYFARQGLDLSRWTWSVVGEGKLQLQLKGSP